MCRASPNARSTPPDNTNICNHKGNFSFLFWVDFAKKCKPLNNRAAAAVAAYVYV